MRINIIQLGPLEIREQDIICCTEMHYFFFLENKQKKGIECVTTEDTNRKQATFYMTRQITLFIHDLKKAYLNVELPYAKKTEISGMQGMFFFYFLVGEKNLWGLK